jgi:3'-phosphoadenosine 5'-phosphosulfate sulfotransferase (PAPS reductase)/FAD synthetase
MILAMMDAMLEFVQFDNLNKRRFYINMKHIIFYSGGIGSWATAKRVIEKQGKENVILLFTDTLIEDADLYRFLDETSSEMNVPLIKIADGRDVWEIFKDKKYLGNSRIAPCSHYLKQKPAKKWIEENYKPNECILYLGIDWTEAHRTNSPLKNWHPYSLYFPMCDEPYLSKEDMLKMLDNAGIKRPRLYDLGFSHNNCGGFCVRAGQGHFINLLNKLPEMYLYHENKEQELREYLKKDVSILSKTKNKVKKPFTLKELRISNIDELDLFDIGGCGCFVDDL